MPKHRASVYTVVREKADVWEGSLFDTETSWVLNGIIGTYVTLRRAEEVMGAAAQSFRDAGVADDEYRFSVQVNTYYDE
jgi:hypothetical protein